MNYKIFSKTALFALATGGAMCTAHSASLSGSRPNIIFVLTDDQGFGDLACHGNPDIVTPQLDALHNKATRMDQFYAAPTCSPCRAQIMSGNHEVFGGVTHTILERDTLSLKVVTVADTLAKSGYATGMFGKWHLGDKEAYLPQNRGFQEVAMHGAGGVGQLYPPNCADAPGNKNTDMTILHNDRFEQPEGYCTDLYFDYMMKWADKKAEQKQPFFAYVATNAPHGPHIVEDKYKKPYLDKGVHPKVAAYYAMITNIDDNIGRLFRWLEDESLLENTLVIFSTDNGSANPQKKVDSSKFFNAGMKGAKGSVTEGGVRVPCFVYWKGKTRDNIDIKTPASMIDLYPTFADLAGAPLPQNHTIRGKSLVPLLENPASAWNERPLFFNTCRWNNGAYSFEEIKKRASVRRGKYKMVGYSALYDLSKDNSEAVDISSAHPEVFEELKKTYDAFWKEAWEYAKDREGVVADEMKKWEAEPWLPPFWERYATQYNYTQEQRDELMERVRKTLKKQRQKWKF